MFDLSSRIQYCYLAVQHNLLLNARLCARVLLDREEPRSEDDTVRVPTKRGPRVTEPIVGWIWGWALSSQCASTLTRCCP